jgi:quinol monooxygenase YgiN
MERGFNQEPGTSTFSQVARLRAQPGMEKRVRAELLGLLGPSRKYKGCINHDLHQSMDDPCVFIFYENWENRPDLDDHLGAPHVRAVLGEADELLSEPVELTSLKMLNGMN